MHIATAGNGSAVATRDMADYLLPGNSREWTVTTQSAPPSGTRLDIISQADIGPVQSTVTLEDESRELNPKMPGTAAR